MVLLGVIGDSRIEIVAVRCLALTLIMAVATVGVPIGILARVAWRHVERSLWQTRRRRLRTWSTGQ
jgi:hypothetical protein